MKEKTKRRQNAARTHVGRWTSLLSVTMAVWGVMSFGAIVFFANLAGESAEHYNPIWMIWMIPAMILIATPITVLIARAVYKHFDILTNAMHDLVSGKPDVYIPTAKASTFAGIYEDFNKMAAEVAGIQRLRTDIVDGFSHELKTPVASINGFAKMLLEEDLPEEKRKKYLEIIVKESDRLSYMAKNNSLLNKIDAQEIVTNKKQYNLGQQIQDIAIAMEAAWTAKNINLTAELPDVTYEGDPNLMESLWQNLLGNAIKFTPKNGDITISLSEGKENIRVSFIDTGIGMGAEIKERIFERYYQGDTSRTGEGNGLGLSIVKRIVRLCGGKITVDSREGEGSTFTVILPK